MTLDIQAIAAQFQQGIPEGDRAAFDQMTRTAEHGFSQMSPAQSSRESWVAALTWVLSVVATGVKARPIFNGLSTTAFLKAQLGAMVVAIAADEDKAHRLREQVQAAVDASHSFWEE